MTNITNQELGNTTPRQYQSRPAPKTLQERLALLREKKEPAYSIIRLLKRIRKAS